MDAPVFRARRADRRCDRLLGFLGAGIASTAQSGADSAHTLAAPLWSRVGACPWAWA
ncbi:hypothetical protein Y013_26250 (plasmid) [Rhodococcus pyridinivorans SB3094]|uniref:Uncharacterized protein n=1 Tax=Rhodococcus pyridinivorans SB3094 TaxID=1435356 RepID=V9XSE1_9NOCA|nr:hypothetical protein Y013_26250 [Rhodococcus pyridinivorans SB3094]